MTTAKAKKALCLSLCYIAQESRYVSIECSLHSSHQQAVCHTNARREQMELSDYVDLTALALSFFSPSSIIIPYIHVVVSPLYTEYSILAQCERYYWKVYHLLASINQFPPAIITLYSEKSAVKKQTKFWQKSFYAK